MKKAHHWHVVMEWDSVFQQGAKAIPKQKRALRKSRKYLISNLFATFTK